MNSTHNFKEYSNRLRQLQGENFICYILKKGNFYYVGIYNNKDDRKIKYIDDEH
jgi:hypothetical protein